MKWVVAALILSTASALAAPQHYAVGSQVASAVPVAVPPGDPLGADGKLDGALVCPNLDALQLAARLFAQVQEGRLRRMISGAAAKYYDSAASLSSDDVLNYTGCHVIADGLPVQIIARAPLPVIRWRALEGITYPRMVR